MSSALETFEESLVGASRRLHTSASSAPAASQPASLRHSRPGWPPFKRLRSRTVFARVSVAVCVLTAGAGVAVAGYLLLAGAQARRLPSFECVISGRRMAIVDAITGSPIADCTAIWPSASGGREVAPRLAIWGVAGNLRMVAVARPLRLGAEPSAGTQHWVRLPDTWTVNLPIVELQDQLNDIAQPFAEVPPSCSFARADVAEVRRLLNADRLHGWRIELRGPGWQTNNPRSGKPVTDRCRATIADIEGASHRVLLIQQPLPGSTPDRVYGPHGKLIPSPSPAAAAERKIARKEAALLTLYRRVNRRLDRTCTTVPAATRLWLHAARAAGYRTTTLRWWREVNTNPNSNPRPDDVKHYTLYEQPASQHTGTCAHVLVMPMGGGPFNVYIARIQP